MKDFKNTLVILLIAFISMNVNAQEEVKESEEKKSSWDAIFEETKDDYGRIILGVGDCISGDCENGYGKSESVDRGIYEGNFKNGLKDGQGTEIFTNSEFSISILKKPPTIKYIGTWKGGFKNGQGEEIEYNKDGTILSKYIGNWSYDKKNGMGKLYGGDRLLYEGNFKNGFKNKLTECVSGDCENGYGAFVYPNGRKYIGEFKNGLKDGFGAETDPNGMYMYGNWKDNKEEGYIRIFDKNNELMFAVEMENGEPLKKLTKNDVEVGCIIGDCENGFGHYTWENGDKHIGEWKNGMQDGFGVISWSNNGKLVGMFTEGSINGYGIQYDASGKIILEAQYANGSYAPDSKITYNEGECVFGNCVNGFGIFIVGFKDGKMESYAYENDFKEKYEGIWENGERAGVGYFQDGHFNAYVGQFDYYGNYQGKGVVNLVDGSVYNGDFNHNRMAGYGTMIYADGSKYVGEWDRNERQGEGKQYDSSGKLIYSGKYNRDERDDE